jgi:5-oxoprolinase (ATP-hydrolysing)
MKSVSATPWQFWIDVGGTFTDCLAVRPDGTMLREKVLSSGVIKGSVGEGGASDCLVDPLRRGDAADLWQGYRLRLLDAEGGVVEETTVERFDAAAGRLHLCPALRSPPRVGQSYELTSGDEAPIVAIRRLMGLPLATPIPPVAIRLGTTRGTNALVTRTGAKTALVTTRGFGDILRIGYQNRPRLFDLNIVKPRPLFGESYEISERIAPTGDVLTAPNEKEIRDTLGRIKQQGFESLAICLLNAYAQPQHEQLVEAIAREVGFEEVSVSHRLARLIKMVSRGDTTVVDAYLNPVLRQYVERLRASLGRHIPECDEGSGKKTKSDLRILTSAGSLVTADRFVGKDSILSGPAGGVVGCSRVAQAAGFERAIGFDMGGTSTDVSRFDGQFELEYETEKAGVRVVAPMMAIETVAAGGGSICRFDGVKLVVGPESAGADPGPACYGRGGPLAVTDLNFHLGKISPQHFPFELDRLAVERRLDDLCREVETATGTRYEPVTLADGLLRVANANMVKAIRSISIAKGCDPRDYVLVCFGGAAPQHACAVARELGIATILNHPDAGVLSAYGLGVADVAAHRAEGVYRPLSGTLLEQMRSRAETLTQEARREVEQQGIAADRIRESWALDLRYRGLDASLTEEFGRHDTVETCQRRYADAHRKLYGYVHEDRPLEIVALRVEAVGQSADAPRRGRRVENRPATPIGERTVYFDAERHNAALFKRDELQPGDVIDGPAVVVERLSTTIVDPHWQAEVLSDGQLLLTAIESFNPKPQATASVNNKPDPILLEIFNNQFAGIAEQMGATLRNTASSVNVKERLDFSCAIFTAEGDLVVNAPHIPVHLGSMSETVRQVIADNGRIRPGDVFVTNNPYRGGTHLPDVTAITPIFAENNSRILFFTASRAHHAEIGGITPGSMPPFSTNLGEEGVLLSNFKLVDAGKSRVEQLREHLLSAAHPTRNVHDNLADLSAQVAANNQGARDLARLIDRYSLPVVESYMRHIQTAAEQKMRLALRGFPDGRHEFTDHLDDGATIAVAITFSGESATIDFTGTDPVLSGNLNANRAIVSAAVMYVLRCLIAENIPLNQGVMAPVRVVLPESFLNPPRRNDPARCAAMVGGNVETSQRIVDVLLGAFGVAAASQGTMNNLLFGDETFGYYETICGGAGATADSDGADAVHTHMTNTRLTDPEVLEQRYPVRVEAFSIRHGSGGTGKHRGGDGVVRKIEFLQPLEVSILSQRRGQFPPYGLHGGHSGRVGRNTLTRADGTTQTLPAIAKFTAQPGDVLTIETPGGGGFG